jgi:hypothetical protein
MYIPGITGHRRPNRGDQRGGAHKNRPRATMGRSDMLNFGRSPFAMTKTMTTPMSGSSGKRGAKEKKKVSVTQNTMDAIQNEVLHTVQLPCSIYVMALNLATNEMVMTMHQHSDSLVVGSHGTSSLASRSNQDHQISTALATTRNASENEKTRHTSWTNIVTQSQEETELSSVETAEKDSVPGDMSLLLETFGHLDLANNRARKETKSNEDDEGDEIVLELKQSLLQLTSSLHATSKKVHTWEEAKDVLGRVITFPSTEVASAAPPVAAPKNDEAHSSAETLSSTPSMKLVSLMQEEALAIDQQVDSSSVPSRSWMSSSTRKRRLINQQQVVVMKSPKKKPIAASIPLFKKHQYSKDRSFQKYLDLITRTSQQLGKIAVSASTWRQVQLYPAGKTALGAGVSTSDAKEDVVVDNEALELQKALDIKRQEDEKLEREIEARIEAKADEAPLPPLTAEESTMVQDILYKRPPGTRDDDVISTVGTDTIQRGSIRKLQPAQWLNDEVIHFYLTLLSHRDEAMSAKDTSRKRSHFFKSFFITKLLDDDRAYNYKNVRRWSKKVRVNFGDFQISLF